MKNELRLPVSCRPLGADELSHIDGGCSLWKNLFGEETVLWQAVTLLPDCLKAARQKVRDLILLYTPDISVPDPEHPGQNIVLR